MARPTKLDDETTTQLTQAVQLGATYELACKYAGITYQTFRNWYTKGESQKSGMYHDFYDAITRAEGAASVQWLAKIEKAASDGNWQAAAWKLERRYPHEYGRRVHELQGSEDAPVVFTLRLGDREMTDGSDSE